MGLRKFSAEQIFDGRILHTGKILVTDENGVIVDLVSSAPDNNVVHYDGILVPGLFNCHCHLELSHLKNVIPPHTGLIDFLCSVVTKRNFDHKTITNAIIEAEKEMHSNGTIAVGDIGNTDDTKAVKSTSSIRWQNFVEVLSFTDDKANENIELFSSVARSFNETKFRSPVRTSLVPHAPYSISPATFKKINELTKDQVISIHNQEHPAEDILYKTGKGDFLKLFKIFGMDGSPFPVTGKSSMRSVLPHFNNGQTILLVHNTYTPEEDVNWAIEYAQQNNVEIIFCFCVNANLYIENNTPDLEMFKKKGVKMVLGTDSYSSNWELSIAKEIQVIHQKFPSIPLENILQWATVNGAHALRWNDLGSFEKGKRPGIVQLDVSSGKSVRLL